jgi:hypothetical protein
VGGDESSPPATGIDRLLAELRPPEHG